MKRNPILAVAVGYGLLSLILRAIYARLERIEAGDPDTRRWWTTRDFRAEELRPLPKKESLMMSRYYDDLSSI